MLYMKDLNLYKKVHFTGIKGVGMTALACIGKDLGWEISGSDTSEQFVTDSVLNKKNIVWETGFEAWRVMQSKPDLVVYTAAHGAENNPEVIQAKKMGIETITQGEALGIISKTKHKRISVAGVGGKTTTTAMLSTLLEEGGLDPSYMVGSGSIPSLEFCGKYNPNGDMFITEADEYSTSPKDTKPKFYYQDPNILILTNLAFDHPDVYRDEAHTLETFLELINKMSPDAKILVNWDCLMIKKLIAMTSRTVITYGQNLESQVQIRNCKYHLGKTGFSLRDGNKETDFAVKIGGDMNIRNACAAILVARMLGMSDYQIQKGLNKFNGVSRRLQRLTSYKTIVFMDDYAHHPDEIQNTIGAVRIMYPKKKLIVIFQPHTYSRTKALFEDFSRCFKNCDTVLLADIYASAREHTDDSVSSEVLSKSIQAYSNNCTYIKDISTLLDYVRLNKLRESVILTMGAGDIFTWHATIQEQVKKYYSVWI